MEIKEIKKGSKKTYAVRIWYYKNDKKYSKYKSGFTGKKEAQSWGLKMESSLKNLSPNADKLKLSDFLNNWIEYKKNFVVDNTLVGYQNNIKNINRFIGDIPLINLKKTDFDFLVLRLSDEGKKHKSIEYAIRTLHVALQYAKERELITVNPLEKIQIPKDKKPFEVVIYSPQDLNSLLNAMKGINPNLYLQTLFAASRGLRRGEILGMRWHDLDFDKKMGYVKNIYIIVKKQKIHKEPKSKQSKRVYNLNDFMIEELKAFKEMQLQKFKGYNKIPMYVFEDINGLPNPTHLSSKLKTFQKANNFPLCRFHDLRHSYAMAQLENNTDVETLRQLMGHSSLQMTQKYFHNSELLCKKANDKVDNIIFGFNKEKTKNEAK